jgi:hypothetical protein
VSPGLRARPPSVMLSQDSVDDRQIEGHARGARMTHRVKHDTEFIIAKLWHDRRSRSSHTTNLNTVSYLLRRVNNSCSLKDI